ncbi:hypothetical protein SNEBB_007759 [Seison nebaliae]|nr:hypothetical protein SNEBB_007759 [Seison nebaliae]
MCYILAVIQIFGLAKMNHFPSIILLFISFLFKFSIQLVNYVDDSALESCTKITFRDIAHLQCGVVHKRRRMRRQTMTSVQIESLTLNNNRPKSGENLIVTCRITNVLSPTDILWYYSPSNEKFSKISLGSGSHISETRNGRYSARRESEEVFHLTIRPIMPDDRGYIMCELEDSLGQNKRRVRIDIFSAPMLSEVTEPRTIGIGDNLTLFCNLTGFPPPTIIWERQGGKLLPDGGRYHDNATLFIRNMKREYRGTYICTGTNDLGMKRVETDISVEFDPEVQCFSSFQTNNNNENEQNSNENIDMNKLNDPLYFISSGVWGEYRSNIIDDIDNQQQQQQNEKEEYIIKLYRKIGEESEIQCVVSGWPFPSYRWYHKSIDSTVREIKDNERYSLHSEKSTNDDERRITLIIHQAQLVDAGSYKLTARFGSRIQSSEVQKCCTFTVSRIVLCCVLLLYLFAGGYLFRYIELKRAKELQTSLSSVRNEATEQIHSVLYNQDVNSLLIWFEEIEPIIRRFENNTIKTMSMKAGTRIRKRGIFEKEWNLFSSILYALTLLSTIGYGHLTCHTNLGKIVTIVYSAIGIPLMALFVANIGSSIAITVRALYRRPIEMKRRKSMVANSFSTVNPKPPISIVANDEQKITKENDNQIYDIRLSNQSIVDSIQDENNTENRRETEKKAIAALRRLITDRNESHHTSITPPLTTTTSTTGDQLHHSLSIKNRHNDNYRHSINHINSKFAPPMTISSFSESSSFDFERFPMRESKKISKDRYLSKRQRREETMDQVNSWIDRKKQFPKNDVEGNSDDQLDESPQRRRSSMKRIAFDTPQTPDTEQETYDNENNNETSNNEPQRQQQQQFKINVPLKAILAIPFYLILGATMFYVLEELITWNACRELKIKVPVIEWRLESAVDMLYFCFTTLTTIGFGDVLPIHHTKRERYRKCPQVAIDGNEIEVDRNQLIACGLYLLLGMILIATILNLLQGQMVRRLYRLGERLGIASSSNTTSTTSSLN